MFIQASHTKNLLFIPSLYLSVQHYFKGQTINATHYLIMILALLYLSGCSTMADSIAAKGTGPYRVYESTTEDVWPIAVDAVNASGLDLVSADEASKTILAQRGMTALSVGENVAIFLQDHAENQCRVEVVSKKAVKTNVFAPDWSKSIFEYLDAELK